MFHSVDPGMLIRELLADLGMSAATTSWLSTLIMVLIVGVLAWLSNIISKAIILRIVTAWVKRSRSAYDDKFLETRVFHRISWIIPGLVIYYMASWALKNNLFWLTFVHKSAALYIVIIAVLTITAFIEGWHRIYMMQPYSEGRSIKPYVQVVKVIVAFTGVLVMASIVFRVSITSVIAGLGVATAVIAIVFKDTILGLVASIQLSTNKMLQLGDWITIPGRNIDGTVTDMSLHTVKVENFDKTIHTIPTYALVSESFQNWKGMEESGVRRIKRDIRVDVKSIALLDAETVRRLQKNPLMEVFMKEHQHDIEAILKGEETTLTNLSAFRAFVLEYLRRHDNIDAELPIMVRNLAPGESGMPVEIYCFSLINQWVPYESVQSGIFEYIFAITGKFGLRAFQSPSGHDIESLKK